MATPLEGKLSRRGRPEDEKMDEGAFQKRLGELVDEIKALPKPDRDKLALLAEETKQRHQELKKTVNNLHESIDFLRLSIKYLLFDLEATRRENGYLRKMLEEQAGS
ncbi:MAG TPA: hypothetical protein PKY77_20030 [Phycisphaerae bacterium]|nr:hypothetical protein [Phycisphaerae bacterium]HRY69219.1 hypothetical protein [Phycisphaerae bacterium]HSA26180.1 hypothetical protein [Phycisphaerae bacterium]